MLLPILLAVLARASPLLSLECGGKTSSPVTYLVSPGYPHPYSAPLLCDLVVEPASPSACSMVLDLGHLTLPPCLPPPSPFRWGLFVGGRPLCGTQRSVDVLLQRPHTLISFRGNPEGGDGFNITVKQQECKSRQTNTWCGGNYSGENVLIVSPGYPTGYPANLDCKYRIIPSIPRNLPDGGEI
ncbi:neuropilin-1-like [Homalodisca vitripennis]|uniref:neuropilin-1-like n=1 Tax=Homalodisca vitripennis TaxID=197043 RepID=UPI001EEBEC21|nr:neuropilin-1-like [Homalodisca vitripennis]